MDIPTSNQEREVLLSQKKLTLLLGGSAISLPLVLYLGNLWVFDVTTPLDSLSSYYFSNMRDFFVGILFAMAMFLITWEGQNFFDRISTIIAGVLAIMVAVFPTNMAGQEETNITLIHNLAAAGLYFILSLHCLFRFTKTDNEGLTFRNKLRKTIYVTSGLILLVSLIVLVLIGPLALTFPVSNPTFWLEYAANFAFGIAWIVRAEGVFFLNDDPLLSFTPWEIFGFVMISILILLNFLTITNILLFGFS